MFGNCQRTFARTMEQGAAETGLDVLMAFEIECFVGLDDEAAVPAHQGPAYSTTRFTQMASLIRNIMVALEAQGVGVDVMHSEYGQGQLEVSVRPSTPVAADTQVLVRQTIRAVVANHGLRVSFAPVVILDNVGNGGHLHLICGATAGTSTRRAARAPAACILTARRYRGRARAPAGAAEHRLSERGELPPPRARSLGRRSTRAGASRTARSRCASSPVRRTGLNTPESANVEIKCFDASANAVPCRRGGAGRRAGRPWPRARSYRPPWVTIPRR